MNNALELFGAFPRKHNCAQAVACGLGADGLYDDLSSCGGGRAPGGMCGALYAAMQMVPEAERLRLQEEFAAALGAVDCAALKQQLNVPCVECVRIAAEAAERLMEKNG